jgi:hypothetical protein
MTQDRFVLVHYDQIARDSRFDSIRNDDKALGLWQRLLWLADAMWPLPAPIPGWASRSTLAKLTAKECGLIEILPEHLFRVHGLDRERERRAAKGKPGARTRWGDANASPPPPTDADAKPDANADAKPDANADAIGHAKAHANASPNANANGVGSRAREIERGDRDRESRTPSARTKPVEPRRARPAGWDDAVAYLAGRSVYVAESSANGHVEHLSRLLEQHGWADVRSTFDTIAPRCHELRQFVLGADNRLNQIPEAANGKAPSIDAHKYDHLVEEGDDFAAPDAMDTDYIGGAR